MNAGSCIIPDGLIDIVRLFVFKKKNAVNCAITT